MPDHPYLQWPVFRRSVVAAFQRSLTHSTRHHSSVVECAARRPFTLVTLEALDRHAEMMAVEVERVFNPHGANRSRQSAVRIVLIGAETAQRKLVDYEIAQSMARGNGLLGIYSSGIKGSDGSCVARQLARHELPVPAQQRVRRDDGCHVAQDLPTQSIGPYGQAPPVVVGEPEGVVHRVAAGAGDSLRSVRRSPRKLPRQVDTAKRDWPADEGLGRNMSGGTRPRLSWGRSVL
jgi:antiphage defense system Thoeris ThsB-like protein